MKLVRIGQVSMLQDFVKWCAVYHARKCDVKFKEFKGAHDVVYVVGGDVIAEERKVTPYMRQVRWFNRVKSDHCYVNEALFAEFCRDLSWRKTSDGMKTMQFSNMYAGTGLSSDMERVSKEGV